MAEIGSSRRTAIGIDVGATKVVACVVGDDARVLQRSPTLRTPAAGLVELLGSIVDDLRVAVPATGAVGVGIAGVVHRGEGAVLRAANHGYGRLRLRSLLQHRTGLPVHLDNDAAAAAWSETVRPGAPARDLLFLAIGTGLGAGILIEGAPWRGRDGIGGELGHVLVQPAGPRCGCGRVGCLEAVASGRALVAQCGTQMDAAIDAAIAGDPHVRDVVEEIGTWLGRAVASSMSLFNLEEVVVGGGLSVLGPLLLDPMRAACAREMAAAPYLELPPISGATHGKDATMIGVGLLALGACM